MSANHKRIQCIKEKGPHVHGKAFLNSYTMRLAIKDGKTLTGEMQTGIGATIDTQRLSHTSSHAKNASAVTLPDLKGRCIRPGLLFCGKK